MVHQLLYRKKQSKNKSHAEHIKTILILYNLLQLYKIALVGFFHLHYWRFRAEMSVERQMS